MLVSLDIFVEQKFSCIEIVGLTLQVLFGTAVNLKRQKRRRGCLFLQKKMIRKLMVKLAASHSGKIHRGHQEIVRFLKGSTSSWKGATMFWNLLKQRDILGC